MIPPAGVRPVGMTDRELFERRLQLNGVERRHWPKLWAEHQETLKVKAAKRGKRRGR